MMGPDDIIELINEASTIAEAKMLAGEFESSSDVRDACSRKISELMELSPANG